MTENQQGHRARDEATPVAEAPAFATSLVDPPSIPGVYLWCQSPSGRACRAASDALGTNPKAVEGLPPSLYAVEDQPDDCQEPTIADIRARLDHALAVDSTGWRDQSGSMLDASMLGDMYSAAGCIHDADPTHAIAKISAAADATPRLFLVRVWDGGTG